MKCNNCGTTIENEGISFCPSCGKYLRQINFQGLDNSNNINNDSTMSKTDTISEKSVLIIKDNKIKKSSIRLFVILVLFGISLGLTYKLISSKNSYYFSDVSETKTKKVDEPKKEEPTEDPEVVDPKPTVPGPKPTPSTISYDDLKGTSKSGYNGVRDNDYATKIIFDRQYFGQVVLKSREDVNNIIKYDSDLQKSGCNANIRAIENEITTNYGVVAVNLCEMDTDFALELKDAKSA